MANTERVKLNDLEWRIYFTGADNPKLLLEEEPCLGMTYFESLEIYVNKELPIPLLQRTIRHELTHATIFSYGFDSNEMKEESICNFMEAYGPTIVSKASELLKNYEHQNVGVGQQLYQVKIQ